MMDEPIVIDKALVIEPGKVYVAECDRHIPEHVLATMTKQWREATSSKLVFLPPGVRIARETEECTPTP